jgi:hypothetical protein
MAARPVEGSASGLASGARCVAVWRGRAGVAAQQMQTTQRGHDSDHHDDFDKSVRDEQRPGQGRHRAGCEHSADRRFPRMS